MIDAELTPEQLMALPLRDAMQLIALMVWLAQAPGRPGMTIEDAGLVPLGEALDIVAAAEAAATTTEG